MGENDLSSNDRGEALPPLLYKDLVRPAAKEVGRTLAGVIRAALAPVNALVWTVDQAGDWLEREVLRRLEARALDASDIVSPRPQLLAGVLRGVQGSGPEPDPHLSAMYAQLLATAMERSTATLAHPAFAEMLHQMTPDEARIVGALARRDGRVVCDIAVQETKELWQVTRTHASEEVLPRDAGLGYPELLFTYLENLERLGVAKERESSITHRETSGRRKRWLQTEDFMSDAIRQMALSEQEDLTWLAAYGDPGISRALSVFHEHALRWDFSEKSGTQLQVRTTLLEITAFGIHFVEACVTSDAPVAPREP